MSEIFHNPCTDILTKYFDEPACRSVWKSWDEALIKSVATSLLTLEKQGQFAPSYIYRLRTALCSGNDYLPRLFHELNSPKYYAPNYKAQNEIKIKSIKTCEAVKEGMVEINGQTYMVIYGEHINGGFCCIPNRNFGCEMAEPTDILYNSRKLAAKFDLETALNIAEAVKEMFATEQPEQKVLASNKITAEDRAVLKRPWATAMTLSARARNCLGRAGRGYQSSNYTLETVEDVACLSAIEIYRIRNLGKVTIKEIRDNLHTLGIEGTAWDEF